MKLYTKRGDQGTTIQIKGGQIPKYDPQIKALGDIDELDSWLGVVCAHIDYDGYAKWLGNELLMLQTELYELLADIGVPRHQTITDAHVMRLEVKIDKWMGEVPPLKVFVLPGGNSVAAEIQYARTLARRAERSVDFLATQDESITASILRYTNRLSDYLFAMARYVNWQAGISEKQV
ncbi:ATP:cob(I)alamin adenosyltransferase [Pediococcus parvulus]|uniref:Corrinoid adenosyltransferase n=1 Tax=Pediococcus parvulus TaxID=54062 RepID=A0AAP5WCF8_9LACO|nr:cob(I)yrinic acid a,c-diamide adenosyltransferase [Pediococcus parvulus]MDV7695273.1 cob(I)yrinic acid a,c-diamide adenosyltransferase [Pediococcus parvulus]OAD64673.1 ATP:cob(I)alamin adenosyltransferase [Pediococcus parvulus]